MDDETYFQSLEETMPKLVKVLRDPERYDILVARGIIRGQPFIGIQFHASSFPNRDYVLRNLDGEMDYFASQYFQINRQNLGGH